MTDLTHIEQIITRALLEGCDNHKTRAQIARETARRVVEEMANGPSHPVAFASRDAMANLAARIGAWVTPTSNRWDREEVALYTKDSVATALTAARAAGVKEGLRRAAALVREKHIVHGAGMYLLVPRWGGNISGLAYADAIEALSLLPKEEGR